MSAEKELADLENGDLRVFCSWEAVREWQFFQNRGIQKNHSRHIVDIGVSQARLPLRIILFGSPILSLWPGYG